MCGLIYAAVIAQNNALASLSMQRQSLVVFLPVTILPCIFSISVFKCTLRCKRHVISEDGVLGSAVKSTD